MMQLDLSSLVRGYAKVVESEYLRVARDGSAGADDVAAFIAQAGVWLAEALEDQGIQEVPIMGQSAM